MISQFLADIENADNVIFFSGAGMSVDSGLPDFRGDEGFWKAYPMYKKLGITLTSIASPHSFKKNRSRFWGFYAHRHEMYKNATPHEGYKNLLDYVKSNNKNVFSVTSNVDGHFVKAGFDTDKVWEIHGSINKTQCADCFTIKDFNEGLSYDKKTMICNETIVCDKCGGIHRPNILMFSDGGWNGLPYKEQQGRYEAFVNNIKSTGKTVVIEVGAGTAIPSIRMLSENIAHRFETKVYRVNPSSEQVGGTFHIPMKAMEFLANLQ